MGNFKEDFGIWPESCAEASTEKSQLKTQFAFPFPVGRIGKINSRKMRIGQEIDNKLERRNIYYTGNNSFRQSLGTSSKVFRLEKKTVLAKASKKEENPVIKVYFHIC